MRKQQFDVLFFGIIFIDLRYSLVFNHSTFFCNYSNLYFIVIINIIICFAVKKKLCLKKNGKTSKENDYAKRYPDVNVNIFLVDLFMQNKDDQLGIFIMNFDVKIWIFDD